MIFMNLYDVQNFFIFFWGGDGRFSNFLIWKIWLYLPKKWHFFFQTYTRLKRKSIFFLFSFWVQKKEYLGSWKKKGKKERPQETPKFFFIICDKVALPIMAQATQTLLLENTTITRKKWKWKMKEFNIKGTRVFFSSQFCEVGGVDIIHKRT